MTIESVEPYNAPENDTRRTQWRLLTGLLAGPVVYSLYFMAVYLLVEAACREALLQGELWGLNALQTAVVGLTAVAVVSTLALARYGYSGGRQAGSEDAQRNRRFLVRTGLWLSGFFVLVTLVTGLPILVLELCTWV
ncbi:MAG: hypothetical protein DYG89_25870 [Caldilinea sp. CFX5]|nr:hypothetical protein [Caldilinea sp. CFX5]